MTTATLPGTARRLLVAGAEQRTDTVRGAAAPAWDDLRAYRATLAELQA